MIILGWNVKDIPRWRSLPRAMFYLFHCGPLHRGAIPPGHRPVRAGGQNPKSVWPARHLPARALQWQAGRVPLRRGGRAVSVTTMCYNTNLVGPLAFTLVLVPDKKSS